MNQDQSSLKNPQIKLRDSIWEYTFLEDGDWIFKAIAKKPVPKEKPHFNIVVDIENSYGKAFDLHLASAVLSITKFLVK